MISRPGPIGREIARDVKKQVHTVLAEMVYDEVAVRIDRGVTLYARDYRAALYAMDNDSYVPANGDGEGDGCVSLVDDHWGHVIEFHDAVQRLGSDAREVVTIVLSMPEELFPSQGKDATRPVLEKFLRKRGWNGRRIRRACDELVTMLRETAE